MAVDDDREHYPPEAPALVVDAAIGLDAAMAAELARRLGSHGKGDHEDGV